MQPSPPTVVKDHLIGSSSLVAILCLFPPMSLFLLPPPLAGKEKSTHKHKKICGIVPALGGWWADSLWVRKIHKQNPPPEIPGQSREMFLFESLSLSLSISLQNPNLLFLAFSEKARKTPPKKTRISLPCRTPKISGKEGKNTKKKQGIP